MIIFELKDLMIANTFRCKKCGKLTLDMPYSKSSWDNKYLYRGYCVECAYWLDRLDALSEKDIVINGVMYHVSDYVENPCISDYLGHGGKEMFVMKYNGETIASNDVWLIGKIPQTFIFDFPNNGFWISKKEYKKFRGRVLKCKSKTCLDRYHCALFNVLNETDPFNLPPKEWVAGGCECEYFIDIRRSHNYDKHITDLINQIKQQNNE